MFLVCEFVTIVHCIYYYVCSISAKRKIKCNPSIIAKILCFDYTNYETFSVVAVEFELFWVKKREKERARKRVWLMEVNVIHNVVTRANIFLHVTPHVSTYSVNDTQSVRHTIE